MLLAIDTSTSQIGLALHNGAQVLAESLWLSKTRHTVELAPSVDEMLVHAGVKINQVLAIGVAIGPGSFTSLRVGLSFAKGLAFARNLPVIGINTLDIVATSQPFKTGIALYCSLPAGRGRLAIAKYTSNNESGVAWQVAGSPYILTATELGESIQEPSLVCGDLTATERQILKNNQWIELASPAASVRRPAVLAELAIARWQMGAWDDLTAIAPQYLHLAEPIPDSTPGTQISSMGE